MLRVLLSRPGEIVTREELRAAVWTDGTFVDFENGLNFCIAQIRSALGDSAAQPRYLKTIPRQGYQFIAPVSHPKVHRRKWLGVAAGSVAALGGGVWALTRSGPVPIAIVRFRNETPDPALDKMASILTDAVVGELSPSYSVIANAPELFKPLGLTDVPAIGQRLRVRYVLLGSLQPRGSGVDLFLQLIRHPDQSHVWVERARTSATELTSDHVALARRALATFASRVRS